MTLDEMVQIEKSLSEIASLISDGGGQGYKRYSLFMKEEM